jgi:DNA-binding CsgD family transcriptional regulator
MKRAGGDILAVVEAAYTLDGSDSEWIDGLYGVFARALGLALGGCAYSYDVGPDGIERLREVVGTPWVVASNRRLSEVGPPREVWDAMHGRGSNASTSSERLRSVGIDVRQFPPARTEYEPHGVHDVLGVCAANPDGSGVVLTANLEEVRTLSERESGVFTRVAIHLAAASRLRRALAHAGRIEDASAVFTATGKIEHAEEAARGQLGSLREAAACIASARGKQRHRPDRALELWQGLVDGTWSLVDRFDTDGRRFLVAHRNAPEVRDPRALTARERQVVYYATTHASNKLIAYELGLSPSTVGTILQNALRKLRLQSRMDLIQFVRALGGPFACGPDVPPSPGNGRGREEA